MIIPVDTCVNLYLRHSNLFTTAVATLLSQLSEGDKITKQTLWLMQLFKISHLLKANAENNS